MRRRAIALALAGLAGLAACADSTTTSLDEALTGTTLAGDAGAEAPGSGDLDTIAEFQAEVDELSDAIAQSEAADDLSTAWQALNAELAASIQSIQEDGAIAREEIETGLEDFEQRLDELDVEEDVRIAWETLRAHLEQLMS